jgi:predicted  nucleic acid-binding Zn-ribbon protein
VLPAAAARPQSYAAWRADFSKWLSRTQSLELMRSARLGVVSRPGESEREFRIRLQQAAREARDERSEKLRKKYEPKMATLRERIRRAEQAVEREKEQAKQSKLQTALSVGATLVGAFLGRRSVSTGTLGRATTAARGASRSMKEASDVGRAQETVEALEAQLKDLEAEFQAEVEGFGEKADALSEELETIALKPKATGVSIRVLSLVWVPS